MVFASSHETEMPGVSQLQNVEVQAQPIPIPGAAPARTGSNSRRRLSSSPIVKFNSPLSVLRFQALGSESQAQEVQAQQVGVAGFEKSNKLHRTVYAPCQHLKKEHEEKENYQLPQPETSVENDASPAVARKKALAKLRSRINKIEAEKEEEIRVIQGNIESDVRVSPVEPTEPVLHAPSGSPVRPIGSHQKGFSALLDDACNDGTAFPVAAAASAPASALQPQSEHSTSASTPASVSAAKSKSSSTASPNVHSDTSPSIQLSAGARAKLKRLREAEAANKQAYKSSPSPLPEMVFNHAEVLNTAVPASRMYEIEEPSRAHLPEQDQERGRLLSSPMAFSGSPVRRSSPIVPSAVAAADLNAITRRSQMLDVANLLTSMEALDAEKVPSIQTLAQRLDRKKRNKQQNM